MPASPLFDPAEFRIPSGVAHVCAAGETPFLYSHDEALRQYAIDKSSGMRARPAKEARAEAARALIAGMWHVPKDDISFVANVAEGVSIVCESIDWQDGDNVCFADIEYPSVVNPFLARGGRPEVRIAGPGKALDDIVDGRTRLIGVSCVSYLDGSRADLQHMRALADRVGAMLVVDYTQAAGYLPIDASVCDFAFSSCYKWLLGSTGTAVGFWNRARRHEWRPSTAGWYSVMRIPTHPDYTGGVALRPDAARLTRGNPSFPSLYILANALDYLSRFEVEAVWSHVDALAGALIDGLAVKGLAVATPREGSRRGANVTVFMDEALPVAERLRERGVYCWAGAGRLRFSFHGYNSLSDVDRIVSSMGPA